MVEFDNYLSKTMRKDLNLSSDGMVKKTINKKGKPTVFLGFAYIELYNSGLQLCS